MQPPAPDMNNAALREILKYDLKEYRNRLLAYANFRTTLYSNLMAQCSPSMEERI